MKPCPNCQFLLTADATECQFCKAALPANANAHAPVGAHIGGPAAFTGPTGPGSSFTDLPSAGVNPVVWDRATHGPQWASPTAAPKQRRSPVRILLVVLAFLGLVGGGLVTALLGVADKLSWDTYTATDGSFTVEAPGAPEIKTVGIERDHIWDTKDALLMVNVADIGEVPPEAVEVGLQAVLDAAAAKGMTIDQKAASTFAGVASIRFSGRLLVPGTNETASMTGEVFVHGTKLYLILGAGEEGDLDWTEDYERLRISFAPGA